jgi:hypothetical protein
MMLRWGATALPFAEKGFQRVRRLERLGKTLRWPGVNAQAFDDPAGTVLPLVPAARLEDFEAVTADAA